MNECRWRVTVRKLGFLPTILVVLASSCQEPQDSRIHVREGVGTDTVTSNIASGPVARAFSSLIGEGIEITGAVTRRNTGGLLELHVNGFNKSYKTKRFRYRVEWLDEDGLPIDTRASVWLPMSAMGKSPFSFKVAATRTNAVDFRMDTKKWE
jgi:hypothetical protein